MWGEGQGRCVQIRGQVGVESLPTGVRWVTRVPRPTKDCGETPVYYPRSYGPDVRRRDRVGVTLLHLPVPSRFGESSLTSGESTVIGDGKISNGNSTVFEKIENSLNIGGSWVIIFMVRGGRSPRGVNF